MLSALGLDDDTSHNRGMEHAIVQKMVQEANKQQAAKDATTKPSDKSGVQQAVAGSYPNGYPEDETSAADLDTFSFQTQQVIDTAKSSPDFLAGMAMPEVFEYLLPPMYLAVWDWLVENAEAKRKFPQLALGLPRGFAKTTLLKLFILYCILFTSKKFILIINAAVKLAVNTLSDIEDMLNESNIVATFGNWKAGIEKDTQDLKKFSFRGRTIILAALGAEGSLRGLNLKNERPDLMLFDDIQSRECADSEVQSDTLIRWMYGTAMKAKSPKGCMFVFLANMYPTPHSILRKLKQNNRWVKFIVGGILSDGTSLWEELQPLEQLLQEFENDLNAGHPEIFYSEVLNDENASVNKLIDTNRIPSYPFAEDEIKVGGFIIIDPSNDKANSDAVAIGAVHIYNGYGVLREVIEERLSPGDTISRALQLASKHGLNLIVVEANAYQYSLLYWFKFICQQLGVEGIRCLDIYSGGRSKNSRIMDMFKQLLAGEVYLHPSTTAAVYYQISQWNALRRDNVDNTLDLVTYIQKVISTYPAEIQSSADILMEVSEEHGLTDYEVSEF